MKAPLISTLAQKMLSNTSTASPLDPGSMKVVDGPIDRTRYSSVAWLPGGESFYYIRREPADTVPAGEEQFHRRVRLHRIGRDPDADEEVFGGGRAITNYYSASVTRDGRWLVIDAAEGTAPRPIWEPTWSSTT